MKIIGQEYILNKFNSYTLENIPKTIMLLGEKGCGKHTLIKHLSKQLQIPIVEIKSDISTEELTAFAFEPLPTLYTIDLTEITEKQQNQFLKFIEEPTSTVFIVLLANSEVNILPTILNRCLKFKFKSYTKEQLLQMGIDTKIQNEAVFEICNTPGKLMEITEDIFNSVYALCTNIVNNISLASYPNTMYLSTKINCSDDFDKLDLDLFLDTLSYVAFNSYKDTYKVTSFKIYMITNKFRQQKINKKVNKESFTLNFFTKLWKGTR